MPELRIVFMGTPDFAVPTLQALVEHKYNVVAVVTAPDKPAGRGQKIQQSPVKEYAISQGIPVLQPTNLKSEAFLEELRSYRANLQIIVAFRMLPEVVWAMPELGSFNIHGSLLPQYRGAAPINWAIINGEKETGVTSFFLKHEIDTGDLIFQDRVPILEEDDFGSMYEKLKYKGAELAVRTVQAIERGEVKPQPQQTNAETKHAPKIFKETCEINWNQPAHQVRDFIRGLSPYPAAWTRFDGKTFKIFKTEELENTAYSLAPGQIKTDNKTYLHVQTADGVLSILDLQMEGKKRMPVQDLLRGYTFKTEQA
ncbi:MULTISPECIES: methionyl-tRNA formyltransferase [Pontibacter]|uniref:Methionyl-tRNA formyltransferase n=1 Tax=Pontibacter lucknowensis TaxID=1077936 RepID=A0A1N6Z473_9BACT|nr:MULTISPECIES: methionyl-tRNA formyltransferase [Pontibacter]EJF11029.1 methionyl-tRNA formyltransferase [Pontibacter sp. BAB1700]SIR21606.1 methionyl-tRNA formyltransferase [Pontibacter lucknowensis]